METEEARRFLVGGGCKLSRRRSSRPDSHGLRAATALEHLAASLVPRVEYLEARRLFATGLADIGRHECYAVADVQRLALFPAPSGIIVGRNPKRRLLERKSMESAAWVVSWQGGLRFVSEMRQVALCRTFALVGAGV